MGTLSIICSVNGNSTLFQYLIAVVLAQLEGLLLDDPEYAG